MTNSDHLVATEDGSLSRRDAETGELFHNKAGAITEALKNYVEPSGAVELIRAKQSIAVLDVCFGLGYNTWMLIDCVLALGVQQAHMQVVGIERDVCVLTDAIAVLQKDVRLSKVRELVEAGAPNLELAFAAVHFWQSDSLSCELRLLQGDLREVVPRLQGHFDVVFHDPFSPARVPELWTVDLFKQYHRLLSSTGGKLLTYSTAVAVRGGLRQAGFTVWRTQAVGSKSGGTLACTDTARPAGANLFALSEDEERKLLTRSNVPYRDPFFSATRADILATRHKEQGGA